MDAVEADALGAPQRTVAHLSGRIDGGRRHVPASAMWFCMYLAANLLFFRAISATAFAGGDGDAKGFIWYLQWVPHAVAHGWNPFLTDQIQAPNGVNIMWNTSVPLLGLLLWPVTATAGAIAAYNVALVGGVTLTAFAGFIAARRFCSRTWPAGVTGAMYGFSPLVVGQSLGHLHFAIAVLPPVIVTLLHSLLVRRAAPRRVGLLLGSACAAQLLIGEELLLTSALMTAVTLAVLALQHRECVRDELPRILTVAVITTVVVAIVDAYPLLVQFFGPGHPPSLGLDGVLVSDLENTVVPTFLQWFAPNSAHVEAARFTVTTEDADAYLGIPLMIALTLALRQGFGRPMATTAIPVGAIALILSFGSTLLVGGHNTAITLPWSLLHHLPLLSDVIPARLVVFTDLAVALTVGVALDDAARSRRSAQRTLTFAAMAAAVLSLLPSPYFPITADTTPRFFVDGAASRIAEGSTVVISPWYGYSAMLWQEQAGMRWRITGGEGLTDTGMSGRSTPLSRAVEDVELLGQPAPVLDRVRRQAILDDLHARGVQVVIIGPQPHYGEVLRLFSQVIGGPPEHIDGVDVFWASTA